MAKRPPIDEKPFRPLDVAVLQSVLRHAPGSAPVAPSPVASPAPKPEAPSETVFSRAPALVLKKLDQEKRILFTREESHALDRLVTALAARLQAQVKVSHVMRAATLLLLRAEGEIVRTASGRGPMIRPPNGDMAALQRFERDLAILLEQALREALPLRDPAVFGG